MDQQEKEVKETFVDVNFADEFALREQLPEHVTFDVKMRGEDFTFTIQRISQTKLSQCEAFANKEYNKLGTTLEEVRAEVLIGQSKILKIPEDERTEEATISLGLKYQKLTNLLAKGRALLLKEHIKEFEHHNDNPDRKIQFSEQSLDKIYGLMRDEDFVVLGDGYYDAVLELERKNGLRAPIQIQ